MGGCISLRNKYVLVDYNKISIDVLLDKWQDQELHIIKKKIKEFEPRTHKSKKLTFPLFLEFFPTLTLLYNQVTHKRIFQLFDYDKDQLIGFREMIYGLSLLSKTELKQFGEIFFKLYKNPKHEIMKNEQFQQFLNENKMLIIEQNRESIETIINQSSLILPEFTKFIQDSFDRKKFQSIFQFKMNQIQLTLIQQLKTNSCKIILKPGDQVYLISFQWFDSWKRYVQKRYELDHEIQFITQFKKVQKIKKKLSQLSSINKSRTYQDQKLNRPKIIGNKYMQGEYQNQIKQKYQYFQDFIAIPSKLWKTLLEIYGGGPEFPRIYPQFHPISVNQVYVNSKGNFIEQKLNRHILNFKDILSPIFQEDFRLSKIFYKKNLGDQDWKKINIENNTVADCQILNQCYICAMDASCQQNFLSQYNLNDSKNYKNLKNYGLKIKIKIYQNFIDAYLIQLFLNNKVKIHFIGKPYESDKIIPFSEFQNRFNQVALSDPTKSNICSGLYNLGNTCYINSVIQCLYYTPIFGNFLVQEKYKQEHLDETQNLFIKQFSKLSIEMESCNQSIKPFDLRKVITKCFKKFANNEQQDAQQFLIEFLNKISEQLSKKKADIGKLDKLDVEENSSQIEKYSIIEKFFSGSQCRRIICTKCGNTIQKKQNFFTLNVPVPQITDVYYNAIFIPNHSINNKQFVYMKKYTIKLKKNSLFLDYVNEFSKILKIPQKNLFFVELTYNQEAQFRRIIRQEQYKSSLTQIVIRINDQIYIFDKTNQIQNKPKKQLPMITSSFINKLQKDAIIDVEEFNQFKPAKFIEFINNQQNQIKYQAEGETHTTSIQNIAPFLTKSRDKKGFLIEVKHRKRKSRYRTQFFGIPFVIYVYQWMTWTDIQKIINFQALRYIDPDHQKKIIQEEKQKQIKEQDQLEKNKIELNNKDQKSKIQESKTQNSNQKYLTSSILKVEEKIKDSSIKKQTQHNTTLVQIKSKNLEQSSKYSIKSPLFNIRLLDSYNSRCWSCFKNVLVQPESQKQDRQQEYVCKGCNIDGTVPISVLANLKRCGITLDWRESRAYQKQTLKFSQDETFKQKQKQQDQMRNSIQQCFKLYSSEQQQVQLKCQKCKNQYSSIRTLVSKSPNILIIHFKRFKYFKGMLEKIHNKISINLEINLNQICLPEITDAKYDLYAITCHRGSGFGGHYYSYILKNEKVWIKCDDQFTEVSELENINLSQIYLLFYRKTNMEASLVSLSM